MASSNRAAAAQAAFNLGNYLGGASYEDDYEARDYEGARAAYEHALALGYAKAALNYVNLLLTYGDHQRAREVALMTVDAPLTLDLVALRRTYPHLFAPAAGHD